MSLSKHKKKMFPLLLLLAVLLVVKQTNAVSMPLFTGLNVTEYAWQTCKAVHDLTQGLETASHFRIQ
jgi:hypothetical protein